MRSFLKRLEYWFDVNISYFLTNANKQEKHYKIMQEKWGDSMVEHPAHYQFGEDNQYEVIKVCEAWGLDKDAYLFNVVKYVARAGKKDVTKELEDLKKAAFYLNQRIRILETHK
jgi:hypothetical protein